MESAFRFAFSRFFVVVFVLALCAGSAFAQGGGSGELSGQVTDPSGAVISGAEVKLTNSATASVRTTVTSSDGIYRFSALPVV